MSTATVEVAYVNQPKPGKKLGNIKLKDESFYLVSPALLGQFKNGGKYEVVYDESEYQGKLYRTVKAVKQLEAPAPTTSGGKYPTDEITAERIFVCGGLNSFIASGKVDANLANVTQVTNILRAVWANTFGNKGATTTVPKPTAATAATGGATPTDDDMNDEIPF